MTATNDGILKADRRGRLSYSPEQRSAMVDGFHASGLSGPRFAALHGVKYQTLAGWLQKCKREAVPQPRGLPWPALLSFVPAELQGPTDLAVIPLVRQDLHLGVWSALRKTAPDINREAAVNRIVENLIRDRLTDIVVPAGFTRCRHWALD